MAQDTKTTIHLDELRDYAVRDLSKLTPGAEVLFVHLPVLDQFEFYDFKRSAHGEFAKVIEVKNATFAELHPNLSDPIDTEAQAAIIYEPRKISSFGKRERYRYASDSGVVSYDWAPGTYNSTNFTVLLSELEEKGLTPILEVTEGYAAELAELNSKVVVQDYGYDYDGYSFDGRSYDGEPADSLNGPAPVSLDELRYFSVESADEIAPGAEVLFVRVPNLEDPELATQKAEPQLVRAKVIELKEATFKELHPGAPGFEGDRAQLVISYRNPDDSEGARPLYRHASTFGLDPSEESTASVSDFVVLTSTLEHYGLRADTELSKSYAEKLAGYNAQVRVLSSLPDGPLED